MAQTAIAETEAAAAFEDFFEAERRRLYRALCLITGDPGEAEEVAQDAFLHLWERWDRVRDMDHRCGFLYRTAMKRTPEPPTEADARRPALPPAPPRG
jgi:DNA-directed RNA polymerase specialized sigma24 family protein